jgi:hypothetical protein
MSQQAPTPFDLFCRTRYPNGLLGSPQAIGTAIEQYEKFHHSYVSVVHEILPIQKALNAIMSEWLDIEYEETLKRRADKKASEDAAYRLRRDYAKLRGIK